MDFVHSISHILWYYTWHIYIYYYISNIEACKKFEIYVLKSSFHSLHLLDRVHICIFWGKKMYKRSMSTNLDTISYMICLYYVGYECLHEVCEYEYMYVHRVMINMSFKVTYCYHRYKKILGSCYYEWRNVVQYYIWLCIKYLRKYMLRSL